MTIPAPDLAIRTATYRLFGALGRPPSPAEVAAATGNDEAEIRAAWTRLHDAHALVLTSDGALRMVNPFSAVETPYVVDADGHSFFANCGWDAFGVGVVLRRDSRIKTLCPDCGERIELDVRDYRPVDTEPVFHVLVPAREWWTDIGFT